MAEKSIRYRIDVVQGQRDGAESARAVQRAVEETAKSAKDADREYAKFQRRVTEVGREIINDRYDVGRGTGSIQRLLGGLGLSGGQEIVGLLGDLQEVREELGGNFRSAIQGVGSILTQIGPLGLAAGGTSAAFAVLTLAVEESGRVAVEEAQRRTDLAMLASQGERALAEGNIESLLERQKALQDSIADKETAKAAQDAARAQETADYLNRSIFALLNPIDSIQRGQKIDAARDQVESLTNEIEAMRDELSLVESQIAKGRAAEGFQKLTAFIEESRSPVEALADLVTGTLDSIGDMAQETADAAAESLDALRTDVQATVDKLDADGTKLGDALRDTIAGLNADLVSAQQAAAADIAEARADAARAELEAVETFNREQARVQRDFEREQKRIRDDARRSELEAIEANDIQALLGIREDSKEQLKENRQRFKDQQADRKADFEARRAQEAEALAATIAGIIQQRDAEIASINDRMTAERAAFDASIAEITRLKEANIAQIDAVIAANERKHAAELAAVKTITQGYEALVYYRNGQLTTVPPTYGSGLTGPSQGGLLGVPPPPIDPFGIGQFFGGSSLPPPSGASSASSVSITMPPGAVIVGDIASMQQVYNTVYDAIRAAAAAMQQAQGGWQP